MAIVSSGQLSMGTLADNKDSASRADLSLSALSTQFASGSAVGDVDGNGSANQTADRNALNTAGFAISEFYDAEFVNEFYDTVVAQLADGTAVTDDGYVDGESGRISFNVNDATLGNSYTVGLKNASTNAVIVDETATKSGTGTKTINFTAPSIDAANNFYYPFVSTGTFENAVGSNIDHYDAIGAVSIDAVSTTTVANTSTDTNITHGRSIADVSSLDDYNWSFVKTAGDGSGVSNGEGGYGTVTSAVSEPTITYRGPGTFTADLRVDGDPAQARNSTTAAQVSHRIDYTAQVTIANPSDVNQGTNYNVTGNHKGHSGGIQVDEILASNNSVLSSNDDSTDSRIVSTNYSQAITPSTGGGDNTRSVKVKAHNNGVSATSNAFDIFPLLTTSKNTINPASETIFATRNNTDTSNFPTTFTFGSPGTRTDNITGRTYSEQADSSNIMSLTGDTTPSSQTGTQPGVLASANVGTATIRYTVQGNSSQTTFTDCTLTVNYSMEVTPTGLNESTNKGFNEELGVLYTVQGFTATRVDGELYDTDDLNTKLGSTAIFQNGISAGALQTLSGTITSNINPATTFSIGAPAAADGEDGFKIKLIAKDSGGTIRATAFTDAFELNVQATDTINTQTLLGAEIGYNSILNAADTTPEGANTTDTVHLIGTIVNSKTVFTSATLATAYDGDPLNDNTRQHYSNASNVFVINDSGVVSSLRSRTPSTLTVGASEVSDSTTTITINITGDTIVTRLLRVSVTPSGGTESTETVAPSSQTTSLNQNYQITSLAPGTTFAIKVRGENNDKTGAYSNIVNFNTDAQIRTLATSDSATADATMRFTGTSFISAHAARNKYSDTFVITVGNCVSNDKCVITTTATGDDLTDFSVVLAANTDNGTSPWNTSTGAEVGTDVVSSASITKSSPRSITFSGLSAGTNTLTCRLRAEYDGSTNNEVSDQTMTATITALVQNSAGSTVLASATMHTVNVEHLPGA